MNVWVNVYVACTCMLVAKKCYGMGGYVHVGKGMCMWASVCGGCGEVYIIFFHRTLLFYLHSLLLSVNYI